MKINRALGSRPKANSSQGWIQAFHVMIVKMFSQQPLVARLIKPASIHHSHESDPTMQRYSDHIRSVHSTYSSTQKTRLQFGFCRDAPVNRSEPSLHHMSFTKVQGRRIRSNEISTAVKSICFRRSTVEIDITKPPRLAINSHIQRLWLAELKSK